MGRWLAAAGAWLAVLAPAAGAATWRDLPVPRTSKVSSVTPSRAVPGRAWAAAGSQQLVTRDGGVSWTPSDLPATPLEDADGSRLWQATDDGLRRSDDGGVTWQPVPGLQDALAATGRMKQLLVDPLRSGVLYVVASTGNPYDDSGESVLESSDGGATWVHWSVDFPIYWRGDRGFADSWTALPGRDALLLVRVGGLGPDVYAEVDVVGPTGLSRLQRETGYRGASSEGGGEILGLTLTGRASLDSSGTRLLLESKSGWRISTDVGAHFRALTPVVRLPPAFDPSHAGRVYALRDGKLFRSDDDGRSWLRLATRLRGAQRLSVDAGAKVYAYGPSGLASSSDEGRTFAYVPSLGAPVAIGSLRDDGRGGLLAATERGVWRIGADERWSPLEPDAFPLPAALVAPLADTRATLVLRPAAGSGARSLERAQQLEVLNEDGALLRLVPLPRPAPAGASAMAFASDAHAQRIILGADWTTTGGRHWYRPSARDTSLALPSGAVYATRAEGANADRGTLWRRAGGRSWTRVSRYAGRACRPVAGGPQRVYVYCGDRLLRSDDAGAALRAVAVPQAMRDVLSMAVDQRRPDRIALLFLALPPECGYRFQTVTLTSADGGATWRRTADACGGARYDNLAVAPNGTLMRWSRSDAAGAPPQVLDGWP